MFAKYNGNSKVVAGITVVCNTAISIAIIAVVGKFFTKK